jgi:hypothetical protein
MCTICLNKYLLCNELIVACVCYLERVSLERASYHTVAIRSFIVRDLV